MLARYSKHTHYYRRPFYKTRGFRFLIALILIAAGFIYVIVANPSQQPPPPTQETTITAQNGNQNAQIVFLEGSAETKNADNVAWEALNLNSEIKVNDVVKTNGASRAILQLPDKSFLRLDANTEITIDQLSPSDAVITQNYGHAFHHVSAHTPLIYRVRHNQIELTALGTAFDATIVGQTMEVLAIANETKIKIYNEIDNSLLNIETIKQGARATINPSLAKEEMIKISDINLNETLVDNWFAWNKEMDKQNNLPLGILGEILELTINEPTGAETTTNENNFLIKGKTDPLAEILINEKKAENKEGLFEFKTDLKPGQNTLQIIAKKDKYENKKTLSVIYEAKEIIAADAKITLTAKQENGDIQLSWATENVKNPGGFITLVSNNPNPTYPTAPSHVVSGTTTADTWKGLESGKYYVRVCLKQESNCGLYSNEIIIE